MSNKILRSFLSSEYLVAEIPDALQCNADLNELTSKGSRKCLAFFVVAADVERVDIEDVLFDFAFVHEQRLDVAPHLL